ncbi:hypothetical protein ABK040_010383 [Willaertia magna]
MPTVVLFVSAILSQNPAKSLIRTTEENLKQYSTKIIQKIHQNHKLEEISLISYDGTQIENLTILSKDTNDLCTKIQNIPMIQFDFGLQTTFNLMTGIICCFEHVEEYLGIHSNCQIIIFTDYCELPSEEMYKIRPPFPSKIHIFTIKPSHLNVQQQLHLKEEQHLLNKQTKEEPNSSTTKSVKEEGTNQTLSTNIGTVKQVESISTLRQLTKLYGGHCYFLTIQQTNTNIVIEDPIIIEFIKKHYDKYSGYLVFGHLVSPVELHPDPNLILWMYQHCSSTTSLSVSSSSKANNNANNNGVDGNSWSTNGNELLRIPAILNIVGFIPGSDLSSPKCISKHTILPLDVDETDIAIGARISKRDRETLYGKQFNKIIKAEACKGEEPANFYQLLHQTLAKSRSVYTVASLGEGSEQQGELKKLCAIVSLGNEKYGYIASCNDGDSSSLILGILNDSIEFTSESYCSNIPQPQLFANNFAYPWLKNSVGHMVEEMTFANVNDIEPKSEQFDLFAKSVNMKTYNYDLKQSKTVMIPFQKRETLSNDFSKILRNAKSLPKKTELVTTECEKLRYIGQVFHNRYVIEEMVKFLRGLCTTNSDKVLNETSVETQEQLLKANRILRNIIAQLEESPTSKLKAPLGEHHFEGISQELATLKHEKQQHNFMLGNQQQQAPFVYPPFGMGGYPTAQPPLPNTSGLPMHPSYMNFGFPTNPPLNPTNPPGTEEPVTKKQKQ